jgi:hypothetical protein
MKHKLYSIVWTFYGEVAFHNPSHTPQIEGGRKMIEKDGKGWNEYTIIYHSIPLTFKESKHWNHTP